MPAHDYWFNEFKGEITTEHREIMERAIQPNRNGNWNFQHAVKRTRQFYIERFTGYARCDSITTDELNQLLQLVEVFATDAYPKD
jgi:hypothetical protein